MAIKKKGFGLNLCVDLSHESGLTLEKAMFSYILDCVCLYFTSVKRTFF